MMIRFFLVVTLLLSSISVQAKAMLSSLPSGDQRILAARQALNKGDMALLGALAKHSEKHILNEYVDYWWLVGQINTNSIVPQEEINTFLNKHRNTVLSQRLRMYLLHRLARNGNWANYLQLYKTMQHPDQAQQCQAWMAKYQIGDSKILETVAQQWAQLDNAPIDCHAILKQALLAGVVPLQDFWLRVRHQVDSRTPQRALVTLSWSNQLTEAQIASFSRLIDQPEKIISSLKEANSLSAVEQELLVNSIARMARKDALKAFNVFQGVLDKLNPANRDYLYWTLGLHGAQSQLPEAVDWFAQAKEVSNATLAQQQWRIRSAIRVKHWPQVVKWIFELPIKEQQHSTWRYWLARAYREQGNELLAEQNFASVAQEVDFYGILSSEELGFPFILPNIQARTVSSHLLKKVRHWPQMQKSKALYNLGLYAESEREWQYALHNQDTQTLIAIAQFAYEQQWYMRAINTSERVPYNHGLQLRYITPYLQDIKQAAKQNNIDPAWVLGVIRQESRFNSVARSSVSAQGLMQIMPATGKWLAHKKGMQLYQQSMLHQPKTNIELGTYYLKMLYDKASDNYIVATAGYNAGPGRSLRWAQGQQMDASIYIETIPFDETRQYVKHVLSNTAVYSAILGNERQSLKKWLPDIPAY